jgi:hypothetical protein
MTRGRPSTRGRWASIAVFAVFGLVGLGVFLRLGWSWAGVGAFVAIAVAGSVAANRVFGRVASDAEKKEAMEERRRDLG